MRRVFFGLVLVAVVAVFANASAPNPATAPDDATVTQISEALQVEFDLAAWAKEDAAALTCQAQSSIGAEFDLARKPGGGSCGGTTCGAFQYCCNPSCGTCVYFGMSCTQQSCN